MLSHKLNFVFVIVFWKFPLFQSIINQESFTYEFKFYVPIKFAPISFDFHMSCCFDWLAVIAEDSLDAVLTNRKAV